MREYATISNCKISSQTSWHLRPSSVVWQTSNFSSRHHQFHKRIRGTVALHNSKPVNSYLHLGLNQMWHLAIMWAYCKSTIITMTTALSIQIRFRRFHWSIRAVCLPSANVAIAFVFPRKAPRHSSFVITRWLSLQVPKRAMFPIECPSGLEMRWAINKNQWRIRMLLLSKGHSSLKRRASSHLWSVNRLASSAKLLVKLQLVALLITILCKVQRLISHRSECIATLLNKVTNFTARSVRLTMRRLARLNLRHFSKMTLKSASHKK